MIKVELNYKLFELSLLAFRYRNVISQLQENFLRLYRLFRHIWVKPTHLCF